MEKLDQGTVIFGIKAEKYPEVPCYGIIVSARCDVANCKVRRLYYIVGVEAREWVLTEAGFSRVFESNKQNAYNQFSEKVKQAKLEPESLSSFEPEEVEKVLEELKNEKLRDDILERYRQYKIFFTEDSEKREKYVLDNLKAVKKQMKEINIGKYAHLYYLPKAAYMDEGKMSEGLVVDLQEIEAISIEEAECLQKGQIDMKFDKFHSRDQYSRFCWLEKDGDFTAIDGQIRSPWCEHLMQRFSNSFIRIGIDGPSDKDFDILTEGFGEK